MVGTDLLTFQEYVIREPLPLSTLHHQRRGKPKSGTDWRDLALLLLTFPELKREKGEVMSALKQLGASAETLSTWKELVAQPIQPEAEEDF